MNIVAILILTLFSLNIISMEQSVTSVERRAPRRRRSELESLTDKETMIGKFVCEHQGCGYVGTYKTVQGHERSEHGIYKKKPKAESEDITDKIDEFKKQVEVNYDSVTQDSKQIMLQAMAQAQSTPIEKEPTMQPPSPEKKIVPIPDQPHRFRPFDRHLLTPEDSRMMTLDPFVLMQTYYKRNAEKKETKLKKLKQEKEDYKIPSSWKCPEKKCGITFENKNRYFSHLIMYHGYEFPSYENVKAHHQRINLINAPSDEFVIID